MTQNTTEDSCQLSSSMDNNDEDICSECGSISPTTIEYYGSGTNLHSEIHRVCPHCVVGKDFPVFRPSLQKWNVGEVKSASAESKYLMEFADDDLEWVSITQGSNPFDDYVSSMTPLAEPTHYIEASPPPPMRNPQILTKRTPSFTPQQKQCYHDWDDIHDHPPSLEANRSVSPISFDPLYENEPDDSPWDELTSHLLECDDQDVQTDAKEDARQNYRFSGHHFDAIRQKNLNPFLLEHAPYRPCKKLKKLVPRMWTPEEDDNLLHRVRTLSKPIKWPLVAEGLSGRTGKQCRERYLNHLNPRLNKQEWSFPEEVTVFRLYSLFGAQWAKMASLVPGRTDNNIKNRFHHVRRKLEKDSEKFRRKNQPCQLQEWVDVRCRKRDTTAFQQKVSAVVGHVASEIYSAKKKKKRNSLGLYSVESTKQCQRCHLFFPSKHCGTKIHTALGWCESCAHIPAYISRESLYDTLWAISRAHQQ